MDGCRGDIWPNMSLMTGAGWPGVRLPVEIIIAVAIIAMAIVTIAIITIAIVTIAIVAIAIITIAIIAIHTLHIACLLFSCLSKKGLCWSSLCVAGDGEINAMRKIKEMSGNNAMLRRGEGGEGGQ